ncbi:hypothetical protein [Massilia sp.]|uniref:hypothetical protein n=1 Tax=Massilia sp. TaxID=1882437 RepID=UPI00391B4F8A
MASNVDLQIKDSKADQKIRTSTRLNPRANLELISVLLTVIFLTTTDALAQTRGLAPVTETQAAKIDAALQLNSPNTAIGQAISEAKSTIAPFLKIHSCLSGYNASSLNVYAAPGKLYPNNNYPHSLIPQMRGHDKSSCLTVQRIHGWTMPSANTLRFEVVYLSDSSGESGKSHHEVQKQANGEWLFSR